MDLKPKVYVIQRQHKFHEGRLIPKFDLSPAIVFGDLEYLLSPTARPFNSESIIRELNNKLQHFKPHDFLLLIGNPVLIGMACIVVSKFVTSPIQVLQWSGKDSRYLKIDIDVNC